jgi:aldehyde:ferredoxin oxidoreductase
MKCFEAGLLTRADTDGHEPRFENAAAALALIPAIANREGLGALLGQGVRAAPGPEEGPPVQGPGAGGG